MCVWIETRDPGMAEMPTNMVDDAGFFFSVKPRGYTFSLRVARGLVSSLACHPLNLHGTSAEETPAFGLLKEYICNGWTYSAGEAV